MNQLSRLCLLVSPLALAACNSAPAEEAPLAGDWMLSAGESNLSFITVKNAQVAEAHSFSGLSGSVSADGAAELSIDLASVETNVDIRNERMRDLLFDIVDFPAATVTAALDPAAFAGLQTGDSLVQPIAATLNVHGASGEVATDLAVTRLGEGKVNVSTIAPIMISAASFDLGEGVEELRNIANLDSITGTIPVTFSLTFEQQAGE